MNTNSPLTAASTTSANTTPRFPAADPDTPLSTKTERRKREAERQKLQGATPQVPRVEKIIKPTTSRRSLFGTPAAETEAKEVLRNGTKPLRSPLFNPNQKRRTYLQQCFLLERVIGKGKFGEVFACRCRRTGRDFAVKVSLEQIRGDKYREAQSLMSVPPHPHLLRIVRAWDQHERLFIQTELCSQSLQKFCLETKNVTDQRIWNFTVDLLRAVCHLHAHRMIHGDIKPDNIFLTEDLRCKLGDFGLAVDLSNSTHVKNSEEGDSMYMAPELLNGKPTKASDMFSVGVSIFESRTDADLPNNGKTWHEIRNGKIPPRFLKEVCGELIKVFMALMSNDPKDRPSAEELLDSPVVKERAKCRDGQIRMMEMAPAPIPKAAPLEKKSRETYAGSATGIAIEEYLDELEEQKRRVRALEERLKRREEQRGSAKNGLRKLDDCSDDEDEEKVKKSKKRAGSGSDSAEKKTANRPSPLTDEERCASLKRVPPQEKLLDESPLPPPRIRGRKLPRIMPKLDFNKLDEKSDTED